MVSYSISGQVKRLVPVMAVHLSVALAKLTVNDLRPVRKETLMI